MAMPRMMSSEAMRSLPRTRSIDAPASALAVLALLGEGRRPAAVAQELGVAVSALAAGALGFSISGAGPSVFALCDGETALPFEAARDWLQGLRRYGAVEVVAGRIFWPHEEYQRMGLAQPLTLLAGMRSDSSSGGSSRPSSITWR